MASPVDQALAASPWFVVLATRVWHHQGLNHRLIRWQLSTVFYETCCQLPVPGKYIHDASLPPLRDAPLTCFACLAAESET